MEGVDADVFFNSQEVYCHCLLAKDCKKWHAETAFLTTDYPLFTQFFFAVHQPQPAISHQKLYTIPIKSKHWPHSAGESSFWHMFSVVGLKIDFSGELTYSWPLMTHGYPWCACLQQIKIEDGEGILSSQRPGNHQSSLIESFLISMGYSRLNPNKRLNIGFLH